MFSDFDVSSNSPLGEIRIADGWSIVSEDYDFLLEPNAGGDSIQQRGKFIYVVERSDDGRWRIATGICNTNHEGDAI